MGGSSGTGGRGGTGGSGGQQDQSGVKEERTPDKREQLPEDDTDDL
jgi:hypothetical protein